jgi:hypothetical protein
MSKPADTIAYGVTMVNTIDGNMSSYTKRDYSRAVLARKIKKMLGRCSTRDFLCYVKNNRLHNCPISRQDILAVKHIFGPDVGSTKRKTVRQSSNRVQVLPGIAIPANEGRDVATMTSLEHSCKPTWTSLFTFVWTGRWRNSW